MSRINTNVSSLIGQRVLNKNNQALNTSLQRLSTGLRINSGADDPAGLIASENLKAEQTGISTAIDNANRANNIVGTAEGGLSEVSNLLTELQSLVSATANSGGLPTGNHVMGGMMMGTDPAASVTDAHGRVHGLDNVYAADGSVFVTSGAHNPTNTIMAVALRNMRHLAGN